jgi:hypothetical protein
MDHIHIYLNEGGITAAYCVSAAEAQFYLEKFEADGCAFEGVAECPGENCDLRHNDPGEAFLEDLTGTGWLVVLPPLDAAEVYPNLRACPLNT